MNQSILLGSSSLPLTQQFAGNESIGTTRLIILKSSQANLSLSPVNKTWWIPKIGRSYLQTKISLQQLKIWNTFKSVPKQVILETPTQSVTIYPGNWTPTTLAGYLSAKLVGVNVTYDPYQMRFIFCPSISLKPTSSANKYIGFPSGVEILNEQISQFPPTALYGLRCINVWTNFTMDNIPFSEFLACVPVTVPYGDYIYFTNYDNSESSLSMAFDPNSIQVILKDDENNEIEYPKELTWDIVLSVQSVLPEGFRPIEP